MLQRAKSVGQRLALLDQFIGSDFQIIGPLPRLTIQPVQLHQSCCRSLTRRDNVGHFVNPPKNKPLIAGLGQIRRRFIGCPIRHAHLMDHRHTAMAVFIGRTIFFQSAVEHALLARHIRRRNGNVNGGNLPVATAGISGQQACSFSGRHRPALCP